MDERKELILRAIVEEYIRTADPVGSKTLCERYDLCVSSATVRNEMAMLEADGYIQQPHTSAGRIPTERGYMYYISKFAQPTVKKASTDKLRRAAIETPNDEQIVMSLAKELVKLTGNMAVVSVDSKVYHTGVSNLFEKPDFQNLEIVRTLSHLLDQFDEVMSGMVEVLSEQPQVILGTETPFGKDIAAVMVKYRLPSGHVGIVGLVGPVRMNYNRNLGLLEEVIDILNE